MMNNRPRRFTRKATLLAGASLIALAVVSSEVSAADLAPMVNKAPPVIAPAPQDRWTWWAEGGAFNTGDPSFGPFPFLAAPVGITPNMGWEGAVGFDYVPATLQGYHFSGQFRYGAAQRTKNFPAGILIPSSPGVTFFYPGGGTRNTTVNVTGAGSAKLQEHHWLVDFMVGRDFLLGSGQAQAQIGVRIADIYAKITGNGSLSGTDSTIPGNGSPIAGVFSFSQRSQFLGIGPRLGIVGSQPLGGSWALDYIGGVAVLFGDRKFDSSSSTLLTLHPFTANQAFATLNTAASNSSFGAVFNLDAQLGISYWFTQSVKATLSYRFDGYWAALRTVNPVGAFVNEDRFYYGPMLRVTYTFPTAPP